MPAWGKRASVNVTANVTITTTTETVLATLAGLVTDRAGLAVQLKGWAQVTVGTGGTALTLRVRRGTTISGALVGEGNPVTVAAAETHDLVVAAEDVLDEGSDTTYVVTVQQTGASANGTGLAASLAAEWG